MKNSQTEQENQSYQLASDEKVVIVASRFNEEIMDSLLQEAQDALTKLGIQVDQVREVRVPGAFEIPFAASQVAKRTPGQPKTVAIVALGCVIEGKTEHARLIVDACAQNLQSLGMETGIPVGFGILAVKRRRDAVERIHYAKQAVSSAMAMYALAKEAPQVKT